jgi:hypothetical protein
MAITLSLLLALLLAFGSFRMFWPRSESAEPAQKAARDQFAADRDPSAELPLDIDAPRAMKYLEEVCALGPRISGTPGMKKQQELLEKHFKALGGKVTWQRFSAEQVSQRKPVEMANLIVSWYPDLPRRVILCSHYDTRPIADQEPDRRKWHQPFLSANDGGSGVALLMELAHHMDKLKPKVGVDFVFFDGEEYIFEPERDRYFFGSQHFADQYLRGDKKQRYVAAVLFDMIGGKDARFPGEQNSLFKAGALAKQLWDIAAEKRCTAFEDRVGPSVLDDHLALNSAGIPAVDIIDFDYAHWHRLSDVPANCSAESLAQVARVLTTWLQRVK